MGEVCRCSKSGDMNKLVEREGFIDFIRVKSVEMKYKFLFEVLTAFCVSLTYWENPQIVLLWVECFGKLKWRAI